MNINFGRKELALTLAGVGVSTASGIGGYFLGKKRERNRILAMYAVENLSRDYNKDGVDWPATAPYPGIDPGHVVQGRLVTDNEQQSLSEIFGQYADPSADAFDYANWERTATPVADEILERIQKDDEPLQKKFVTDPRIELVQLESDEELFLKLVPESDEEPVLEFMTTEPVVQNVFAAATSTNDTWDYNFEMEHRSAAKPYVIHQDEFFGEESEYAQTTVTYYAGDNVVADSLDQPAEDWEAMLGPLRFGHGTTNANAVYIRNDKLQTEYEVLLHTGSYLSEVLGQEAELAIEKEELKHSLSRRFREE